MKKNILFVLGVFLLAALALPTTGCGDNNDGGVKDSIDTDYPKQGDAAVTPPKRVKVYIDASGSMKAYYHHGNIQNIADALSYLGQIPDSLKHVSYQVWGQPNEIAYNKLTEKLLKGELKGKDTLFDEILGPIAKTGTDTLTFLFTDGIISSSSRKTSINGKFTDLDKGTLVTKIQNALRGSGKAVSVYRIMGGFDGTYYNKANDSVHYKGERPFFVMVIGAPENVRYFDTQAAGGKIADVYKSAQKLHIGTAPDGMAIQIMPTNGNDNMASVDDLNRQPNTFDYVYTGELGYRITAELPKWIVDNLGKDIVGMFEILIDNNVQPNIKPNLEGSSITFDIPANIAEKYANSGNKYTVSYRLKDPALGAWDTKYSTDDDTTPDSVHTYLLKDLIDAMYKGIRGDTQCLLESSITILPSEE